MEQKKYFASQNPYKYQKPRRELSTFDLVGAAAVGALTGILGLMVVKELDQREVSGMISLLSHLKKNLAAEEFKKVLELANTVPGLNGRFEVDKERVVLLQKMV